MSYALPYSLESPPQLNELNRKLAEFTQHAPVR